VLSVTDLTSEQFGGVSLEVHAHEIVGIAGITGSGRDALCATIFGARIRDRGAVLVNGTPVAPSRPDLAMAQGVAYVPAERKLQGCFVDLTARENIGIGTLRTLWRFPRIARAAEKVMAQSWFDKFDVRPSTGLEAPVSSFSGGNQQKIVFGKWFQRGPSLFLLDEPTQGVDVGAKAELHRALFDAAEAGAGVLIASSDVDELVSTCDRVIVLLDGRVEAILEGDDVNPHAMTRAALGIGRHSRPDARPAARPEEGAL
jgi:ribose transport system ATP-binding protein